MRIFSHEDAFIHLNYILKNQVEDFFIATIDNTIVHYGEDGGFDADKIVELNIKYYNLKRKGGAIVASPGDVVYCFTSKKEYPHFDTQLRKFLFKKFLHFSKDVKEVDNDLLVEDRKCTGTMHQTIEGLHFYGGHISINCNLSLIQRLCTKPIKKVPGGLSTYGITTEDVIKWLQEFWFYYKK